MTRFKGVTETALSLRRRFMISGLGIEIPMAANAALFPFEAHAGRSAEIPFHIQTGGYEFMKSTATRKLVFAALLLALAMVLPFLTGQIPQIGQALCPMHIPVLLCGFVCGPIYAMAVGFIAPLLRFALFGMPPIFPTGVSMAFELLTYGLVAGLCYKHLPRRRINIYASLLIAMVAGRLVWGVVRFILTGLQPAKFGLAAFWAGAVAGSVPGIIVHIVLIPLLVMALEKAKLTIE